VNVEEHMTKSDNLNKDPISVLLYILFKIITFIIYMKNDENGDAVFEMLNCYNGSG